ncbi:hypothetical protein BKA83DRAFT_4016702, partial [Pisolithus microcarpus]
SLKWTRVQLLKSQNLCNCQHINSWNAFIRAKLCDTNSGCNQGDHVKLTQFVAQNKDDLLVAYKNLTLAQQEAYNAKVQVAQDTKVMVVHSNPKAVSHTVSATFANMDWEWTALHAQTGLEGFYIAVRGTVKDLSEPKHQCPLNKLISECCALIQEELDYLLMKKKVSANMKMNYTNYECQIVECYGIMLTG